MAPRRGLRHIRSPLKPNSVTALPIKPKIPPAAPPPSAGPVISPVPTEQLLPELTAASIRLLLGKSDPRILEIGANDGTDTLEFLKMFPGCYIRCYECDPRAIATWRSRIHEDDPRVSLFEVALGDEIALRQFHPSGGKPPDRAWEHIQSWDKSGSLLKPDRHTDYAKWLRFGEPFDVTMTTLDSMISADEIIDFIWIDVQGAEALVFRGGQRTIPRVKWIYCECHSRPYYCNQATLAELLGLLPGFVLHSTHAHDNFLLFNTAFTRSP